MSGVEVAIQVPGKAKASGKLELQEAVFDQEFNETLVHQVCTAYLAGARQGTQKQKNRHEVSGGGRKPWKQKGTGRARAGTSSSPIWRSGGVTFAARPRSYEQKVNKKMYRGAMRSIMSELRRSDRLVVVESLEVESGKTKDAAKLLKDLDLKNVLIVTDTFNENLYLASRNIPNVDLLEYDILDPVSLVGYDKVLITVPAVKLLEERLQ